jgi:hypothetical protein
LALRSSGIDEFGLIAGRRDPYLKRMVHAVCFVVLLQVFAEAGSLHSYDAVLLRTEAGASAQSFHSYAVLLDRIDLIREVPLADMPENLGEVRRTHKQSRGEHSFEFSPLALLVHAA